jgi:AcrR family transcriptional regulator
VASERMVTLLEAACRVISRQGAERLRMSDVAREAGVSTALVHYYFATRADLLLNAFAYADEKADARVDAETAGLPAAVDRLTVQLAFYVLEEDVAVQNAVLWHEMWSQAVFDDRLRDALAGSYEEWLAQLSDTLSDVAAERGIELADRARMARRLAAIVDGLGMQLLVGMLDHAGAADLIRESIAIELGLEAAAG